MVYGQDNKLYSKEQAEKIRTLTPYFDVNNNGEIELQSE
jgi:hypothetical protein